MPRVRISAAASVAIKMRRLFVLRRFRGGTTGLTDGVGTVLRPPGMATK